jgi:DNA-binding NarL/FixJ family response regulator
MDDTRLQATLRIAIADDHALFREGLKALLKLQPGVTVVAEAERTADIFPILAEVGCDVLLLDLRMDRNALGDIARFAEKTAVVVVTANEHPADALAALRAGARGVVFKRFAVESLMDAVRTVAAGQVWMPPALQTELVSALREPAPVLTPREHDIIRHVALGLRNSEVAQRLFISEQTVKTHLNNIFQKLGVRDRVELARYAMRVGLIGMHEQES